MGYHRKRIRCAYKYISNITTYSVGDENGRRALPLQHFYTRSCRYTGTDTLAITDNTTLDGQATFTLAYAVTPAFMEYSTPL